MARIASYKTLRRNIKIRRRYAIDAIERQWFDTAPDSWDEYECEMYRKADSALSRIRNNEMGIEEMMDWALREAEYKSLI